MFYNSYLKRIKLKSLLFEKVLMSIYTLLHVCAIAMKDMPAKQTGGQAIDKLGHFGSIQCKDAAWEMVDGEESSGFTFYSIKFKSIIPGNWQQQPWCIFRQEFF